MKFRAKITEIGPLANDFKDANIYIIFNEDVPEELKEFAILHEKVELKEDIAVGDCLKIGSSKVKITAVGTEVNKTLIELGHLTLKLDGENEPELPGTCHAENKDIDFQVGDYIEIG
ncbi:MAG: PTS glucitol/sorbitol transporter subunit IIA [Tissierellia bacterium]|nr:PTS glucitol/sorbitol transporter subunit IIA [Tissierellia bacterium]